MGLDPHPPVCAGSVEYRGRTGRGLPVEIWGITGQAVFDGDIRR
jgi:hypothetical protein